MAVEEESPGTIAYDTYHGRAGHGPLPFQPDLPLLCLGQEADVEVIVVPNSGETNRMAQLGKFDRPTLDGRMQSGDASISPDTGRRTAQAKLHRMLNR